MKSVISNKYQITIKMCTLSIIYAWCELSCLNLNPLDCPPYAQISQVLSQVIPFPNEPPVEWSWMTLPMNALRHVCNNQSETLLSTCYISAPHLSQTLLNWTEIVTDIPSIHFHPSPNQPAPGHLHPHKRNPLLTNLHLNNPILRPNKQYHRYQPIP